jgi:hypothetical protein
MLGRDSRTLSKFFEALVNRPVECEKILIKAKEAVVAPQRKFIEGLRY